MSGYIVRVGKRSYAFGLIWSFLPGVDSTRSEIKSLAEDHDAIEYVTLQTHDKRHLVGLLEKDFTNEKGASKTGALAAASVLASLYKETIENAIFGMLLPNGMVGVIGFRDGLPLVGFDRVVALDEVESVVSEYLRVLKDQAQTAVFYGHEEAFPGRDAAPCGLDLLTQAEKTKVSGSRLARVKKPVALVLSLMILLAGGGYGFHAFDEYQKEQARKASIAVIDPNKLYEQSLSAVLSAAGYPVVEVAWQMIDTFSRLPLSHQGWRLVEMVCEQPGSCVLSWSNDDGGTYESFSSLALPGVTITHTEFLEGLNAIKTTVDFPVTGKQGINLQFIPKDSDYLTSFGTRAQRLKDVSVPVTLQKGQVVGLPPTPAGQQPITETVLKKVIKDGSWTMTGDWIFNEALRNMPLNMTLTKLQLNIKDESISFIANGKYYVQK